MTDNLEKESQWQPGNGDTFAEYERLRSQCPVAYSDSYGGFWSLFTHGYVSKAARDWKTFRSGDSPFVEFPDFARSVPISLNPPEHSKFRKLLNTYFQPDRIAAMEPTIRKYVDEHVDAMIAGGRGDAIDIGRPLPQRTLALLLNMPEDAYLMFVDKLKQLAEVSDDPGAANELIQNLWTAEVIALVEERKVNPLDPGIDLMSGVLSSEIDGKPLSFEDCVAIGIQLFGAGGETTTSAIANSMYYLAINPDDQRRLRSDPALIPDAIEEFLRLRAPLHHMARTTTTDVSIGERTIPANSRITLNYASANHDASVFPDPDKCVIDRSPNRHMSFGFGPHQCLGAPIARLELRLTLEAVFAKTSMFELDGEPQELQKVNLASGFASLPLKFAF